MNELHYASLDLMYHCASCRSSAIQAKSSRPKYNTAHTFWSIFFEEHCQRPNATTRIFPVNKTYPDIFGEYFKPWFTRMASSNVFQSKDEPAFQRWRTARDHADFKDVKDRVKHTHARCQTCADLKALMLAGFKDGASMREYKQRRRMHDQEVARWRALEKAIHARVIGSNGDEMLIIHDGTVKKGFPNLGHRTLKNLNPSRFDVVPWMAHDISGGRSDYIYAPNASTSKSTNYLLSQFHAVVRRAKSDYTHPRHRARKLTVIADSASENKNNILFAYYTDMVTNGWFDEVELLFGPVGHTHNGVDATHKIHNVDVSAHIAGDLGHFVRNYTRGFSGQAALPTPSASILGRIVDWKKHYDPLVRPISGFTKTSIDPPIVRGFRIARQQDGSVDLRWKSDPANEKDWRGESGFGNTPGFFLLRAAPRNLPLFELPSKELLTKAHAEHGTRLNSLQMRQALVSQGLEECVDWNVKAHMEGKIPIHRYIEESTPAGEWGRLCEVGAVNGKRGFMREITTYWDEDLPDDHSSLWKLPVCPNNSQRAATSSQFHFSRDSGILANAPLPMVRHRGVPVSRSAIARHPNNMEGNGWVREEEKDAAEDSVPEAAEDIDHGEVDRPAPAANAGEVPRRYEEKLSECIVGSMVVGLSTTTKGPTPYIFVGKIIAVQKNARPYPKFTMVPYNCIADNWTPACLVKKWNKARTTLRTELPHYSVIKYFPKLNNNTNIIPKTIARAVREREIKWYEEEE